MAKVDQTKASRLLSATKTMSLGANKNSIRILYGNHVAENIDFRSEPQQHVKKGIRGWSRRADNRRAFSAVIDVAVNYFGFDPIHPESGNDSNLLIVFYVQIMPDDFVMQLHR
ncbi:hypothetical protein ABHB83_23800, partial [Escherichia coli]|nr:hypothetical protein [Escherichia coli]MCV6002341.1 hypothetical protein [Escherichia coli]MDB8116973.1 hypothetical protein [Escherichia coli]